MVVPWCVFEYVLYGGGANVANPDAALVHLRGEQGDAEQPVEPIEASNLRVDVASDHGAQELYLPPVLHAPLVVHALEESRSGLLDGSRFGVRVVESGGLEVRTTVEHAGNVFQTGRLRDAVRLRQDEPRCICGGCGRVVLADRVTVRR